MLVAQLNHNFHALLFNFNNQTRLINNNIVNPQKGFGFSFCIYHLHLFLLVFKLWCVCSTYFMLLVYFWGCSTVPHTCLALLLQHVGLSFVFPCRWKAFVKTAVFMWMFLEMTNKNTNLEIQHFCLDKAWVPWNPNSARVAAVLSDKDPGFAQMTLVPCSITLMCRCIVDL